MAKFTPRGTKKVKGPPWYVISISQWSNCLKMISIHFLCHLVCINLHYIHGFSIKMRKKEEKWAYFNGRNRLLRAINDYFSSHSLFSMTLFHFPVLYFMITAISILLGAVFMLFWGKFCFLTIFWENLQNFDENY